MTKNEKCSLTQKGRIVIHKEDKEKRVYSNEVESYLLDGWLIGVSEKHRTNNSLTHKEKASPNKGNVMSEESKEKISNTLKSKYESKEIVVWNKGLTKDTDDRVLKNSEEATLTKIKRYGSASPNFGKHLSEEHKAKIGKQNSILRKGSKLPPDKLLIKTTKQYLTRKKNNTFNTSDKENLLYEKLLEENKSKTIYRNYKDKERYPFYCDFYILEDDLFIELNAHWTHGGKPYDPNDKECQQQLAIWQEKAKTSQFYRNAIETWTIRDVEKQKIAKENNLNYEVIY